MRFKAWRMQASITTHGIYVTAQLWRYFGMWQFKKQKPGLIKSVCVWVLFNTCNSADEERKWWWHWSKLGEWHKFRWPAQSHCNWVWQHPFNYRICTSCKFIACSTSQMLWTGKRVLQGTQFIPCMWIWGTKTFLTPRFRYSYNSSVFAIIYLCFTRVRGVPWMES